MSATFIERVLAVGDYGEDGGGIDPVVVHCLLKLYSTGNLTASYIKTNLSTTTPQGAQLDEILATMPTNVTLTVLGVGVLGPAGLVRAEWATKVYAILMLGRIGNEDYNTNAKCETALGI